MTIEVLPSECAMTYEALDESGSTASRVRCVLPMVTGNGDQPLRSTPNH